MVDATMYRGAEVNSDHYLVKMKLKAKLVDKTNER